jgi:hypothetical protein
MLRVSRFASNGLGDSAVTDAAGACLDGYDLTGLELVTNFLQVRHETTLGLDVRVRDVVAALGTFSTNIANLCHCDLLMYSNEIYEFSFLLAVRGW